MKRKLKDKRDEETTKTIPYISLDIKTGSSFSKQSKCLWNQIWLKKIWYISVMIKKTIKKKKKKCLNKY